MVGSVARLLTVDEVQSLARFPSRHSVYVAAGPSGPLAPAAVRIGRRLRFDPTILARLLTGSESTPATPDAP